MRPLFIIGICTGLSEGDICTLRWDEIRDGRWIVRRRRKTGASLEIPVLPPLAAFLDEQRPISGEQEYILPEHAVFEDLLKTRPEEFLQVPAKTRADDFLLMRADADPAARIISNDMYRDYAAEYPWVGERKRFIRGMVMRDEVFLLDGEGNRTRIPAGPGKSSDWSLNE